MRVETSTTCLTSSSESRIRCNKTLILHGSIGKIGHTTPLETDNETIVSVPQAKETSHLFIDIIVCAITFR